MEVLITGGAGYLGSIMSERMLEAGYNVTVVDSLRFQQNSLFHLCANPNFEFVSGDVRDEGLMSRLVKKADVIINTEHRPQRVVVAQVRHQFEESSGGGTSTDSAAAS